LEHVTEIQNQEWSQSFVLPYLNIVRYGWMFFPSHDHDNE